VLDDRDRGFAEALQGLNVSKNAAVLITYLANVSEATSREIEIGTGLRQPEVSIGMRMLHENNWVTEYEVKSERKGRPMKVYSLCASIEETLKHYEEEKGRESALAMETIQRLKEMATN
jgi:predicted transcriptional regulator